MTQRSDGPFRILHVVDNMGKGGLENGLANLIERLDPAIFEHIVLVMRHLGMNSDRLPQRARIIHLDNREAISKSHIGRFIRIIRQVKPAIVHSRNWGTIEAVPAARIALTKGIVHSEHGLDWTESAQEPLRRRCFRRLAYEMAGRVFSVSSQLREVHAARTGFPASRISVIHNGVDSRRYSPDPYVRARVREELGIGQSELCIGCVGNLSPVKDYKTLLRAIERFAAHNTGWRLIIFGDGPERPALQAFVQAHPEWAHRVSMPGIINRIPEMMKAFDVYVLPSLSEGISNSLLEAMATGLPVVATHTGGNPEVIVDGDCGLLFGVGNDPQLAEHLRMLQREQETRQRLAGQALRRVEQEFSISAMVRNYTDLYCSLLPGRKTVHGRLLEPGSARSSTN